MFFQDLEKIFLFLLALHLQSSDRLFMLASVTSKQLTNKGEQEMVNTINCMGMELELTDERKRRIASALIETQEKLEKEMRFPEDLRKQGMVDFYEKHIAKLVGMLS